ncbi:hypothetical protein H4R19_001948 [Coemansia spiralis]|nr:hypothetical protein H4R19_001948 [Coemansia spiralis]
MTNEAKSTKLNYGATAKQVKAAAVTLVTMAENVMSIAINSKDYDKENEGHIFERGSLMVAVCYSNSDSSALTGYVNVTIV